MEGAVEEARSDNTQGINTQDAIPSQGNFTQTGLTAFTQTNTVANGTHQVGIPQVLENQTHDQNEALRQPHVHENVGMGSDDSHPTSLGISAVHGGVQVAVAVPIGSSAEGVSEGGAGVDRSDEVPQTASNIVTAMPAEYGLPGTLSTSYVLQQESEGGEEGGAVHSSDVDGEDKEREDILREQDRFLPIANVARIMKKSIPKNGKIAKDAKECVQECVSEFISFITSEFEFYLLQKTIGSARKRASERCHQEKRKTINGEDILFAMQTLGFDNYVEPLKLYLQKYRESIKGEKSSLGSTTEHRDEMEEDEHAVQSYQVPAHIHPTMITTDQPPTTIYSTAQYPATFQ